MTVRFPRALRAGDQVAVVSPAGPLRSNEGLETGLARLRAWGLRPVVMPHARDRERYLGGRDDDRAADLQQALADPALRAVFATRGGYGCTRLLDAIDWAPLAADPKPVVGFSDLTALLAAAWRRVGVVGLHGPMIAHGPELAIGESCEGLQRALLFSDAVSALPRDGEQFAHAIVPGAAEGRLLGGNLALVVALIGTPWELDTRGALLFLEDTGEEPYRIDRMLTQLRATGALARCAGIVLGDFHVTDTPLASESREVTEVLHERLSSLSIPVAYGFPFGHRPRSWTLPFGVRARLQCPPGKAARLDLLEAAVR